MTHYDSTVSSGTQYAYAVAACSLSGWTVIGPATLYRAPGTEPPGRPSAPRFRAIQPTSVTVEWDGPADVGYVPAAFIFVWIEIADCVLRWWVCSVSSSAVTYKLFVADGTSGVIPSPATRPVYQGSNPSFTHTGLQPGRWYAYGVVACNESGESRMSMFETVNLPTGGLEQQAM